MYEDTFIREIEIEATKEIIKIHQGTFGDVGCVVWDAAIVLGHYLLQSSEWKLGRNVLELGAGTGVVGIIAAYLGANVCITDLPELLPLIEKNILENKIILTGKVKSKEFKWGSKVSEKFDVLLIADCIYYEESIGPLIKSINDLCNEHTVVLFCFEERKTGNKPALQKKCFQILEKDFVLTKLSRKDLHPQYQSPDIHLYQMKKKIKKI